MGLKTNDTRRTWAFRRCLLVPLLVLVTTLSDARSLEEVAFQDAVKRAMQDRVKGYAFVIADRDGIVAKASDGFAQAPTDGNLRMKTFIPANVGSISKVASGLALLDLLEQGLVAGPTVADRLNTPIRFFVPDKWIQAYFNAPFREALNLITLRNLLNHRSGLPDEASGGGTHGTKIARALAEGANAITIGKGNFDYNNNNITLLLYIIPALAYRDEVDAIERNHADLSLAEYNRRSAEAYGALYERYMREAFFPRMLAPISPTCRPAEDIPSGRYAKEYDSRTDPSGVVDNPGFCRSQGSWFYSAQDLAQLARTMAFSNRLIDRSTRRMLFDPNAKNDRLIYSRVSRHPFLAKEASMTEYPGHGGDSPNGSISTFIRLPFGYVGVGVANSPELSVSALTTVLLNAFYAATRNWTEFNINRPGMDYANIPLIVPDPEQCRLRCKDDPRCQSWTYVKPGVQGNVARCWLKSGIPATAASNCCSSGVKGVAYGKDRPGSDYRSLFLGRADVSLCRAVCGLDTQCKAWTYVKPGLQGSRARCWLKKNVPRQRKATCCASGRSP